MPIVMNYTDCECLTACSERLPEGQLIQYGNYKNAQSILKNSGTRFKTMSAAVVYIQDQSEISHIEIPDYRKWL